MSGWLSDLGDWIRDALDGSERVEAFENVIQDNADTLTPFGGTASDVAQYGGKTVRPSTGKKIIEHNGLNPNKYHPRDIGKALDKMKTQESIPHDQHFNIHHSGAVVDANTGEVLGNLLDYL